MEFRPWDPGQWLLIAAWAAGAFGAALLARGVRRWIVFRRSNTCVSCGYDLSGLGGRDAGRCPECGRDPGTLGRRRLRLPWRSVVAGVCLMLAGAVVRFWLEPLADWVWTRVLPREAVIEERTIAGLRWRLLCPRDDRHDWPSRGLWSYKWEVQHPLLGWIRPSDYCAWSEKETGSVTFEEEIRTQPWDTLPIDMTGDGIPEHFVHVSTDWMCCCALFIVNPASTTKPITMIELGLVYTRAEPGDIDGDGVGELLIDDPEFVSVFRFDQSPPRVILTLVDGILRPCVRLMRRPPLSTEEFAEVFESLVPFDESDGMQFHLDLTREVVSLLYSGNEGQGWELLESVCSGVEMEVDRERIRGRVKDSLERSAWWPQIRQAYANERATGR